MDAGTWRGIFTAVMLVLFIGVWVWAWSGKRKATFDAAARLPLEEDGSSPRDSTAAAQATAKDGK